MFEKMKVYRGVVVSVQDESYIVITPEGELIKVKKDGQTFEVGEEILFYERIKPREGKHWLHSRTLQYTACMAAGLLIFFSSPFSISDLGGLISGKKAYAASFYIESKSNVKIGINNDHKVISVEPLNDPAKTVLKRMDWSGEQVGEFVKKYFSAARQTGYLGPCDKAIISVDPVNDLEKDNTIGVLQKHVRQNPFLKENDIQVFTVTVPDVVVEKAEKLGVTPGKFSIYLAATSAGKKIPADVLKVAPVTDLVDAAPIVAKVLPHYSEKQLAQLVQQNVSTPKIGVEITVHKTGTSTTSNTTTLNATSKDAKPSGLPSKSETTSDNVQKQLGSPSKQPAQRESQQKIIKQYKNSVGFPPVQSGASSLHL
jgi:hypothetical protein